MLKRIMMLSLVVTLLVTTLVTNTKDQITAQEVPLAADDHTGTAILLVDQIMGDDTEVAYIAATELLRRAAIPLVSPEGPIVAFPDDLVLEDAALYADFVPQLVDATRRGDVYTAEQLVELIAALELTPQTLPANALIAGLGMWGKRADSAIEAEIAGAAVRALSAQREQVLYAGADPATTLFDPLQTIIILAHLTATSRINQSTSAAPALSGMRFQTDDPCLSVKKVLEGEPFRNEGAGAPPAINAGDKHGVIEGLRGELITAISEQALGENLGGNVSTAIDRGTKALNLLLILMGAQIQLTSDKDATHYRHTSGSEAENVHLTATAIFNSSLAQNRLVCYELAGLSVPPSGPLEGFKIIWSIDQPLSERVQEGGRHLTTISADSNKIGACGTCGETTTSTGTSTLELYPRTEQNPGVGEEMRGNATVYASLDKVDFPFKLSDFIGLREGVAGASSFAWTKLYDLAINAMTRAGLPSASRRIAVTWHGTEIYTVSGSADIWMFYVVLPVTIDIYSCTGVEGPWQGTAGLKDWDVTMFGELAAALAKQPLPDDFQALNTALNFSIPAGAGEGIYPFYINELMSGEMELDTVRPGYNRHGGKVGTTNLMMGEYELQPVCDFLGCSTEYPIIAVAEDERCGDQTNAYQFD